MKSIIGRRNFGAVWVCIAVVCIMPKVASCRTITVQADGNGDYPTIQEAIDAAVNGDVIILAEGIYTGTGNRDIDFLGKAITVQSTEPNDPNIVAATIIDCNSFWPGFPSNRGFYFHNGEDGDSVLDGLTIKNGFAPLDMNNLLRDGGGILIKNSSPTIRNCIITSNEAACMGEMGIHAGRGGGICCYDNSNAVITNCTFTSNTADTGAGVACCSSSPTISNCIFSDSSSYFGGGISCEDNSNPLIINCTIRNNSISDYGAGICCFNSNPTVLNCTISGNSGGAYGGGIGIEESNPVIKNCVIVGNYASDSGGGIYCGANINPSNPSIINCTIANNHAGYNDYEHEGGGGIAFYYTNANITNSVLWGNTAVSSGPQIALFLNPSWPSTLTVSYCDIQGGQASVYVANGSTLDWHTGNIDIDPCFVEPGYWVFDYNIPDYLNNRSWVDGDYHLLAGSPCIDAGDNNAVPGSVTTDLDGNPRFVDEPDIADTGNGTPPIVDMGAYEYNPPVAAEVDIEPETLNLQSKGVITAFIELPESYSVEDIDPDSLLCQGAGAIRAIIAGDILIVKFDREELQELQADEEVELLVSGELADGTRFEGKDVIRVIDKAGKKK